ncbi:ExbD/TolR family protein [Merismopedia glauca]|uniref:Biopolymer transporter ExbD n=1 Tax=Merismopedia glauca CCAP 1448/3 TaxID=1296344 RepID=A0A2T1C7D9_9CYAN|nr:biopolymer transporter ExbD [Merismopedia glauca]PSB04078.1 biopolymer transporter ExbD [Merismopedia glauca CCAP 1448/3]
MKIYLDSEKEAPRVEIIPFVDIMFCLLIFFLLAALQVTRYQAVTVAKANIPQVKTGVSQITQRLVVSLDKDRQVYVDGKFFGSLIELTSSNKSQQIFQQKLRNYLNQSPSQQAVLYAPKTANYNDVLQTLDLLRLVMGDRVALGTLPTSP